MTALSDIKEGTPYIVARSKERGSYLVGVGKEGVLMCLVEHMVTMFKNDYYNEFTNTDDMDERYRDANKRKFEHLHLADTLQDEICRMKEMGLTEEEFKSLHEMKNWVADEKKTASNLNQVMRDIDSDRNIGVTLSHITKLWDEGNLFLDEPLERDMCGVVLPENVEANIGMFVYHFVASRALYESQTIEIIATRIHKGAPPRVRSGAINDSGALPSVI